MPPHLCGSCRGIQGGRRGEAHAGDDACGPRRQALGGCARWKQGPIDPITGESDFAAPPRLVEACQQADGRVASTPVCICYSTDTVGGNSGSPVLDAEGKFVAINFDRQRLGLMNEFKWSIDYSRSIGTDVVHLVSCRRVRWREVAR